MLMQADYYYEFEMAPPRGDAFLDPYSVSEAFWIKYCDLLLPEQATVLLDASVDELKIPLALGLDSCAVRVQLVFDASHQDKGYGWQLIEFTAEGKSRIYTAVCNGLGSTTLSEEGNDEKPKSLIEQNTALASKIFERISFLAGHEIIRETAQTLLGQQKADEEILSEFSVQALQDIHELRLLAESGKISEDMLKFLIQQYEKVYTEEEERRRQSRSLLGFKACESFVQ